MVQVLKCTVLMSVDWNKIFLCEYEKLQWVLAHSKSGENVDKLMCQVWDFSDSSKEKGKYWKKKKKFKI